MPEPGALPDVPTPREALARASELRSEAPEEALSWVRRVVEGGPDFAAWRGAAALLTGLETEARRSARRVVRLGVVGSYTTSQLVSMIRLAAFRHGMWVDLYEGGYAQFTQEVLDEQSGLYTFEPDIVLFAVHDGALELPDFSQEPASDIDREVDRWTNLWQETVKRSGARVVHHMFVSRPDGVFGNLALKVRGARASLVRSLNTRLGENAPDDVALVDCEALAGRLGKEAWFDDRYWFISKQAVSLGALPELARHTAAVMAGQLGLARKVLVLDLDNTLWGGVIAEDGLGGIALGQGSPDGEAFTAFQRHCRQLRERGIVLAVCSKNDEHVALEPFRDHPDMVLTEGDFAAFVANWQPKSENLVRIAGELDLGLDSMVFADDNPVERDLVRRHLPDVEVLPLPADPSGYVATVAGSLLFESVSFTEEDRKRNERYSGRAAAARLAETTGSLDEFLASLEMTAAAAPFDDMQLPRIVQLIAKTNQFNVTTRRHSDEQVRRFMRDPDTVTLAFRLTDRFTDHGLTALLIAREVDERLVIDTWLMSCRVIGRTFEHWILDELAAEARRRGVATIEGRYIPTDRNRLVSDLFERLGFESSGTSDGESRWVLDLEGYEMQSQHIARGTGS